MEPTGIEPVSRQTSKITSHASPVRSESNLQHRIGLSMAPSRLRLCARWRLSLSIAVLFYCQFISRLARLILQSKPSSLDSTHRRQ